jgi:hypothetical protein
MLPSRKDRQMVESQLGRTPRALREILVRCGDGHPAVVMTHPFIEDPSGVLRPMPTLYWLTCPQMRKAISRLEEIGAVRALELRVESEPELYAQYLRAHESYRSDRLACLSEAELKSIRDDGYEEAFFARGIGGVGNLIAIKCLHLQVAHHLATYNPIGQIVMEKMGVSLCLKSDIKLE